MKNTTIVTVLTAAFAFIVNLFSYKSSPVCENEYSVEILNFRGELLVINNDTGRQAKVMLDDLEEWLTNDNL